MKEIFLPWWIEIFAAFALGIVLAYYRLDFLVCLLACFILLFALAKGRLDFHMLFPAFILLAGLLYFNLNEVRLPSPLPASIDDFAVKGQVASYPRCDDKKCSFVLEVEDKRPYLKKIQVFAYFDAHLNRGDEVLIRGELKKPEKPGNPGEFDYASFLEKEKIFYILTTDNEKDLRLLKEAAGISYFLGCLRKKTEKIIKDTLSDKEAGILLGMLLGKKEEIDPQDYREFQKSGIVHIFAVSGLHVGFLVFLMAFILSFLSLAPGAKTAVIYIVLLLYGSITGWPASVARAVIMALAAVTAFYLKREVSPLNSLGLAGFIILLLDPYALFKTGFQLSFMATWGLLYIYPLLKKAIDYKKWWLDLILVPLSAQLAVLPLIAYYFYLFTPAALVANIFVSYLAGGAIIAGFLGMLAGFLFPFLSPLFIYPAGFMIEIMQMVVNAANAFPFSYLWVKKPEVWLLIFYYAGILFLCGALYSKTWKKAAFEILIITVFFIFLLLPPYFYNRGVLEITFIDVGQGDSILIKTPEGKFILIDGGGSRWTDIAGRKLLPYLHSRGINRFYMLVNSHPDTDHLKGLEEVALEHRADFLCLPGSLADVHEYDILKSRVFKHGGKLLYLEKGKRLNIEKDFYIEILYPEGEYKGGKYNDYSLVLYVKYRGFSALLPGDIEEEGLQNLLYEGIKTAYVVKVPHHGSRGSLYPGFYEEVNPYLAVISVGKNNFGHPHAEVLNFLKENKIEVLRTDEKGAITLLSDGSRLTVSTFRH